jgi:hypothetical protein
MTIATSKGEWQERQKNATHTGHGRSLALYHVI